MSNVQDLQLPFIIYGVISAIIICIALVIILFLVRKLLSRRSENNINRNNVEFSLSDQSGPSKNFGNCNKTSSGDTMKVESSVNKTAQSEKYEELGHIRDGRNNYETLTADDKSTKSRENEMKELYDRKVTDDKNYEELHPGTTENTYESIRNDANSQYANS